MTTKEEIITFLTDAGFQPAEGFCNGNCVEAAILLLGLTGKICRIWNVTYPDLGPHSYLEIDKFVFSEGVSWPDSYFPEQDLEGLQNLPDAIEFSTFLAFNMWTSLSNNHTFINALGFTYDPIFSANLYGEAAHIEANRKKVQENLFTYGVLCARRDGFGHILKSILDQYLV